MLNNGPAMPRDGVWRKSPFLFLFQQKTNQNPVGSHANLCLFLVESHTNKQTNKKIPIKIVVSGPAERLADGREAAGRTLQRLVPLQELLKKK